MNTTFGALCKKKREELGFSLRHFCRIYGYDSANMSRMERGLSPPPKNADKLKRLARALEIHKCGSTAIEFRRLAIEGRPQTMRMLRLEKAEKLIDVLVAVISGEYSWDDREEIVEEAKNLLTEFRKNRRDS